MKISYQVISRHGGNLNAYYKVKEATEKATYFMIPTT